VLRHPPELARELQLGDLLLQRHGNVVTGLEVNQSDEGALEFARIRAPVQLGTDPTGRFGAAISEPRMSVQG